MSRFTIRGWAGVYLLALAAFVIVLSLLPNGATTLDALGGVLAQPVVVILVVGLRCGLRALVVDAQVIAARQ